MYTPLSLSHTISAEVSVSNHSILAQFCKDHNVGLVLVGPEVPLAAGRQPISLLLCLVLVFGCKVYPCVKMFGYT